MNTRSIAAQSTACQKLTNSHACDRHLVDTGLAWLLLHPMPMMRKLTFIAIAAALILCPMLPVFASILSTEKSSCHGELPAKSNADTHSCCVQSLFVYSIHTTNAEIILGTVTESGHNTGLALTFIPVFLRQWKTGEHLASLSILRI